MNTYFLTSKRQFIACEIETETKHQRTVKITEEGHEDFGKVIHVHPERVATGNLYPRVFKSESKPTSFFEFHGRILVRREPGKDFTYPVDAPENYLVPKQLDYYSFQPITRAVVDSILDGDKMLLTGEAGTGKTSLVEQIAAPIGQPVLRINLNGESRMADLVGKPSVVAGETGSITKWEDGPLPTAMKNGYWLILDEIDMAQPEILSLLHPVLEPNGKLVIKEGYHVEEVIPHPNFRIFGTANGVGSMQGRADAYTGTNSMNLAFMDRWHVITVPHLPKKDEIRVLRNAVPHLPPRLAVGQVEFGETLRKGMENGVVNFQLSTRAQIAWAMKSALYRNAIKGAEATWLEKQPSVDQDDLRKQLVLQFGRNGRGSKPRSRNGEKANVPVPDAPKKKRGRPRKNP